MTKAKRNIGLEILEGVREIKRGEQINPLDLVEWLEDEGYVERASTPQPTRLPSKSTAN